MLDFVRIIARRHSVVFLLSRDHDDGLFLVKMLTFSQENRLNGHKMVPFSMANVH